MAITQAIANAFKKQLLEGDQNFSSSGGDVFKLALYTSSATLNSALLHSQLQTKLRTQVLTHQVVIH